MLRMIITVVVILIIFWFCFSGLFEKLGNWFLKLIEKVFGGM